MRAALLVSMILASIACGGPASKPATPENIVAEPAPTGDDEDAASRGQDPPLGTWQEECFERDVPAIERYITCFGISAAERDVMRATLDATASGWAQVGSMPAEAQVGSMPAEAQVVTAQACRSAFDAIRRAVVPTGCGL